MKHILLAEGRHVRNDLVRYFLFHLNSLAVLLEPGVVEELLGGGPLGGVLGEALLHELDSFWRQGILYFAELGEVADNGAVYILLGAAVEGRAAREEDMSDDAHAPNVHALVIGLLLDDFGSHVEGRAEDLTEAALGPVETGEAEVCQFQIELAWRVGLFWRQKDVLGLNVPVHNVLLVHVVERKEELFDDVGGLSLGHPLDLDDMVVEFAACDQLSDDVEVGIVLEQLEDADHMRMVRLLQHVQLLFHEVQ